MTDLDDMLENVTKNGYVSEIGRVYTLTDRAHALLETRAQLDGETP